MKNPRFLTVAALILVAALSRLVPHPWNATPVAAISLFAGASLSSRRSAVVVPLIALFVSDLMIGFYPDMPAVYLSMAMIVFLGSWLRTHKTVGNIVLSTVAGSGLFFIITNFSCWITMADYTKDLSGLALCYARAVPFFRGTLAGDAFYSAVLFGVFALSEHSFPRLREARQPA